MTKDITDYFFQHYKHLKTFNPGWGAAEGKLCKEIAKFVEKELEDKSLIFHAIDLYLQDDDELNLKNGHSFKLFASKFRAYLKPPVKPPPAYEPPKHENKALDDSRLRRTIDENPRAFVKGFRSTGAILKQMNPVKFNQIRDYLIEKLGREECRKIWLNTPKISLQSEHKGIQSKK